MPDPSPSPPPSPASPSLIRGAGVAAWRQIVDGIEADIASGRLAPGDRLAPETSLAERFGVNRHTVRRALSELAARGLVRATQGRGTFVEARTLAYPIGPRTRFTEIVAGAGRQASGELISARETAANAWAAERLGLAAGAPVLELVTMRAADGTPISLATSTFPLPRFAGLDALFRETRSLTLAYRRMGIPDYRRLTSTVTARPAAPEEAAALDLAPGRILLVLDNVNTDPEGTRIQATRALFSADRVEMVVEW
ncbi:phosphonate metabolism transcriptional regulator PhnF [Salinarimonas ramus]|uniref:Phosphonate metabolism transcriptional regulator PhnF n=1 Tax=Salinarimonas ramus TaxID=690164 RepID=A0A917Q625_9HYPH|nr:phosphonate metabolism transcriptional regulator PhnF [Salinarimonas ramus]GGK30184.1 phosphonate metabolism transcriptional regulator PhnF [Salinarimonas ramus]